MTYIPKSIIQVYWDKQKVAKFNSLSFRCKNHCLKTKTPKDSLGKPYQVSWCSEVDKHCNFATCPNPEKFI